MKLCVVFADNQSEQWKQKLEFQNLLSYVAELGSKGVETVILREIIDEETTQSTIQIEQIKGGLLWNFRRSERPENYAYWDPYFESALHRIVWEYGIEVVQLILSNQRTPGSLAPTARLLGTKLVISMLDANMSCPKGTLFDDEEIGCSGPESHDKCAHCISCRKFGAFHAAKHRSIIWQRHLTRVFSAACAVTFPDEAQLGIWNPKSVAPQLSNHILPSPVEEQNQESLAAYLQLLNSIKGEEITPFYPKPISIVVSALDTWRNPHAGTATAEALDRCLESIFEQAISLNAQVLVAIDAARQDLAGYCQQKYARLNLDFLRFSNNPTLSDLLSQVATRVTGERTFLLASDRTYARPFFAAHLSLSQKCRPDTAILGITTWAHSKGLECLEEFALTQSVVFGVQPSTQILSTEVPWQGISIPSRFLLRVQPNCQTLAEALGTQLPLQVSMRALSALHETLTLDQWLHLAQSTSLKLGRSALSTLGVEQSLEHNQLKETAHGNLGAHRTLGLAGMERIIGYDEYLGHLLQRRTPGVWFGASKP